MSVVVKRTDKANSDIGTSWVEIQTCKDCFKQRAIRKENNAIIATPWVEEISISVDQDDIPVIFGHKLSEKPNSEDISKELPIVVCCGNIDDEGFEIIGIDDKSEPVKSFKIVKVEPHKDYIKFINNKFTLRYIDLTSGEKTVHVLTGERLLRLIEDNPYVVFYAELLLAAKAHLERR